MEKQDFNAYSYSDWRYTLLKLVNLAYHKRFTLKLNCIPVKLGAYACGICKHMLIHHVIKFIVMKYCIIAKMIVSHTINSHVLMETKVMY